MPIVQVYKDREGTEYILRKANRVNWLVERVPDGRRLRGNASLFTYVREMEEEVPEIDPLIRPGAIVNLTPDCPVVLDHRNSHTIEDVFVVIGFGKLVREFKVIEAGGNPRNQYYNLSGVYLTLGDD